MGELSTRIWLDEQLWEAVRKRAIAEGITVRELIPRLVEVVLVTVPPATAEPRAAILTPTVVASPEARPEEPRRPVVAVSEIYQCGVCGAEVRLGGLSNHLGKHLKEQQASDVERS